MLFDPTTLASHFRQSRRRPRHRRRRLYRNGQLAAVKRAIAGARLVLGLPLHVTSQVEAAASVGVSVPHLTAAIAVLRTEDADLLDKVLTGKLPLRTAAKDARRRGNLIDAYRRASPADRVALARTIGAAVLWDEVLEPAL
jgi:hypothetical protein